MHDRAARFKQVDVTRAVRGAREAGLIIAAGQIDERGIIVVSAAVPGQKITADNPLDRLLTRHE